MMLDTLVRPATFALEVKHSRFIAHAAAVDTPAAALAFLGEVSDSTATHNCWAYRIGALYRSSDDGEPAGTAGRPILAAIDGQHCDSVVTVVTRWYGGINLGAGGLVRAYGGCAAECLRMAPRQPLIAYTQVRLAYRFEDTGAVHAALAQFAAQKLDEVFTAAGAQLLLRLPVDRGAAFQAHLRDATRDRVDITTLD